MNIIDYIFGSPLNKEDRIMDIQTILLATYEITLSVIFGLITIFLVTKMLNRTLLKADSENALSKGNISIGLFAGTLVVCNLMLVQPSILPSINSLQAMAIGQGGLTFNAFMVSFGFFLFFYIITAAISIGVLFAATWLYLKSTIHIDEIKEINKNNIAVSVMLSLVILGMTLFIKPSLDRFVSSFVNYDIPIVEHEYESEDGDEQTPVKIMDIE